MVKDQIASLDDNTATGILNTIAKSMMRNGAYEPSPSPEMAAALESVFPVSEPTETPSEGDMARAALEWLSEDPEYAGRISVMITGSGAKHFSLDAGTIGVLVAAIVLLQTHVRFERDKKGKISVLMEKKAASDSLLKSFVEKLLGMWKMKK